MKKFICVLLVASFGLSAYEKIKPPPDEPGVPRVGLLTFPRSGTFWLTYSIIHGSERHFKKKNYIWYNFGLEADLSKPLLLWSHHSKELKHLNPEQDKLIVLVRNYRECIIRNYGAHRADSIIKKIRTGERGKLDPNWYFENLQMYDDWNEENRLLVYYEEMIKKPRETLERVLDFIGEDHEKLDLFFENFEHHRKTCLAVKNRESHNRAASGGKDLHFHSRKLTKEQNRCFDTVVQKSYPELWERYLKRYRFHM